MELTKSANILALGSVILEYHKKNNNWPENRVALEHFYDSAKIFMVNFDTLSFQYETNSLTVKYRFIENPSSRAILQFVERDEESSEKPQREWCHELYSRSNIKFDGELLFKYDKGYFTCL